MIYAKILLLLAFIQLCILILDAVLYCECRHKLNQSYAEGTITWQQFKKRVRNLLIACSIFLAIGAPLSIWLINALNVEWFGKLVAFLALMGLIIRFPWIWVMFIPFLRIFGKGFASTPWGGWDKKPWNP